MPERLNKPSNWNLTEIAAAFPNVSSVFYIFVSCLGYWKCQVAKLMEAITLSLRPKYIQVPNKHISNGFLERQREFLVPFSELIIQN